MAARPYPYNGQPVAGTHPHPHNQPPPQRSSGIYSAHPTQPGYHQLPLHLQRPPPHPQPQLQAQHHPLHLHQVRQQSHPHPGYILQQPPPALARPIYATPQPHHPPAYLPHNVGSPRPHILARPMPLQQPSLQQQQQPIMSIPQPTGRPPAHIVPVSMPSSSAIGPSGVLRTPSLGAVPMVSSVAMPQPATSMQLSNTMIPSTVQPNFRPIIAARPAGVFTAGPATVVSSGLGRMPMRPPVIVPAGPPTLLKTNARVKALLERPVPFIKVKQRVNTLLSDFWGEHIDVTRSGAVIDRSELEAKEAKEAAEEESRRKRQNGIVVGIDFGNTFTGVSYAHQADGEMIDVVKWPKHSISYAKVPTISLYKASEPTKFLDWGSSAMATYRRTKKDKLLVRDYKLLLFDQDARGKLDLGLHLTDVFTQYLSKIHGHLLEEVNKSQVLAAEAVPAHYCVTVPQSWTIPTRELVLRCFVEAKIILQTPATNMTVITEAEAAATYCRENCDEFEALKDGDIFMICDAGGLTTNVTVFRVDDCLGVRQFVRMSSSHDENCGSVNLDRSFKSLVLSKLAGLDVEENPTRLRAFETLLEGFEEIKAQFDLLTCDEVKHLSVPMGLDVNELDPPPSWLEEEYMSLRGKELCDLVFDPVVEKVLELINIQSRSHSVCAGLFMVGGFGSNKYLQDKLQLAAAMRIKLMNSNGHSNGSDPDSRRSSYMNGLVNSIGDLNLSQAGSLMTAGIIKKVIIVPKAEMAVARGAVIYGLKSASQHTKAFL